MFPLGTIPLGLNHPRVVLLVHYLAGQIPLLFPPLGIFSIPVMAFIILPNMNLGILVWYIDPPARNFPSQLRPYHALTLVQLIHTTSDTTPVPSHSQ